MIYLICGKAQSGKDTCGLFIKDILEEKNHKVCKIQFMRTIKGYVKDYFGWDGKEETKPRDLLQYMGTELIRLKLNKPLFHINRLIEDIEILSEYFDTFVIDDVRLPIEIEKLREKYKNVIVICIKREINNNLSESQNNHITEHSLDNYTDYDYIIDNNGTLDELKDKIKEVVINNEIYD